MDINANVELYLKGRIATNRYSSFDYCYNYFQSFHESGRAEQIADPANLQVSCLQLGFFLASWGMMRGSTFLAVKSAKFLEPTVRYIAAAPAVLWNIDLDSYTEE